MPYPRTHDVFNSSFCGVPMRQLWSDLVLWELFLRDHREIHCIVELGSGYGGMSLFLAAQAAMRNQAFYTLDRERPAALDTPLSKLLALEHSFILGDYWESTNADLLRILHAPELKPLMLFIDGGDKPKEFRLLVPELSKGDYVSVHDWGKEFTKEDSEPVRDIVWLTFWEECEAPPQPCMTRFWARL